MEWQNKFLLNEEGNYKIDKDHFFPQYQLVFATEWAMLRHMALQQCEVEVSHSDL